MVCVGLLTRAEESYRLWGVVVCDLVNEEARPAGGEGGAAPKEKKNELDQLFRKVVRRSQGIRDYFPGTHGYISVIVV